MIQGPYLWEKWVANFPTIETLFLGPFFFWWDPKILITRSLVTRDPILVILHSFYMLSMTGSSFLAVLCFPEVAFTNFRFLVSMCIP